MEYNINNNLKNEWLAKCDISIKDIAEEFLNITQYISNDIFDDYLAKSLKEMLEYFDNIKNIYIQFFIPENSLNKSNYWVIKKLVKLINDNDNGKYIISINSDIKSFNNNFPIIIADDASYSGSQICSYIEDYIDSKNYKLFLLIPFISKIAIERIRSYDNNIKFIENNRYELKPLTDLMENEKIKRLFSYYGNSNITQYPIYFNHKVADSYSSFPLIYSYGIMPNQKNKEIISYCKIKLIPLKNRFDELERIVFLNNCNNIIINSSNYDINNPIYPIPPYKI
jgi:hypothetical protein